jgi:phosphoribosylformylglycinamidine synthase II
MTISTIQLTLKDHLQDVSGLHIAHKIAQFQGIATGRVKSSKVYSINYPLTPKQLADFAQLCLSDVVLNHTHINQLHIPDNYRSYIAIAKLPGVTDDEGISAQKALADWLNVDNLDTFTQHIFSQELYYIENDLSTETLQQIAQDLLGNKLINHFQVGKLNPESTITIRDAGKVLIADNSTQQLYVPSVQLYTNAIVNTISLAISDEALLDLSKKMILALNLAEMKAIQAHYADPKVQQTRLQNGLPKDCPTDCELEVLAQTWSEHCKHKEFNAIIDYKNHDTGEQKTISSLFKTYIKGATDQVRQQLIKNGNNWLIKVFNDNAGVVQLNQRHLLVWKVETHNSPSALDPYGGAITGILGNNRDPLGTGIGGAKLLFNTNVLCFGSPKYAKPLLTGQLHPQRIFSGVRHGIEDGGNKSGVPTVNGAIVFDDRYSGKPLVYCGTGGLMPAYYEVKRGNDVQKIPTWEKNIAATDRIMMAGGRVGKDGIHGATFSSVEIDEHSPASAVQIGSPITQKLLGDFLVRACSMGLIKCSTDNGAGGLSSSIGELATISGGAKVQLANVPLKYAGLQPWEIFVSESQERMTLVVAPENVQALQQLAQYMEVELSDIGEFTDNGYLTVQYNDLQVAHIDMHFLHDGLPQKYLTAEWKKPFLNEKALAVMRDYSDMLLNLLRRENICSREWIIRQYDHEVKGKTIVKPLMGAQGKCPQDAAVLRLDFDSYEGIAVSNGIIPRYGDLSPYDMSAGAFDEAIRQIISVGGQLPNCSPSDNIAWSVNDNFCVPDSVFDAQNNPDGKQKLAALVQMCEALYDMATFFDIPLTSGKDSMKNDFKADGQKISVPPTILYSITAKINDVRRTVTANFKAEGDAIYLLGDTYNELGGSEFYAYFDKIGANVPQVRKASAKQLYQKVMAANAQQLIASCHDLSDGGLAIALAECVLGSNLGMDIDLTAINRDLRVYAVLFSESHSRFVVSVAPKNRLAFEQIMDKQATYLGKVTKKGIINMSHKGKSVVSVATHEATQAWSNGLMEL